MAKFTIIVETNNESNGKFEVASIEAKGAVDVVRHIGRFGWKLTDFSDYSVVLFRGPNREGTEQQVTVSNNGAGKGLSKIRKLLKV